MKQMNPRLGVMTTSWDDGHPCDMRVADLLEKHRIAGTFYVPRRAETETMTAASLRRLSCRFEIGAHTLDHVLLTKIPVETAWQEVSGSKSWIEDQTGTACRMFCPPRGRFDRRHVAMARQAGFIGLRSIELASLDLPSPNDGLVIMPTTLQAFPHSAGAYLRNTCKRGSARNLLGYLLHGRASDWAGTARKFLERFAARGGVFHLWGHSWEIEQANQWQRLDEVLGMMSTYAARARCLANGRICITALAAGPRGVS